MDPGSAAHRFTLRCVRGNGGYRPFTFRHTAKSVNVCSSVAG